MGDLGQQNVGQIINYGAFASKVDSRDLPACAVVPVTTGFKEVSLPWIPPVYNQSWTSQCVAFTGKSIIEIFFHKDNEQYVEFSNSYIYGLRGDSDYKGEGMYPNEMLNGLLKRGCSPFKNFSLGLTDYRGCADWFKDPINSQACIDIKASAFPQKIKSYVRCYTKEEFVSIIESGNPVVFVVQCYPSFVASPLIGGVVPQVKSGETYSGLHCMYGFGTKYINGKEYYKIRNSWGTNFGDKGDIYFPCDYAGIQEMWGVTDIVPPTTSMALNIAPVITNGRTLMGLRDLGNLFGVTFDTTERTPEGKLIIKGVATPSLQTVAFEVIPGDMTMKLIKHQ